MMRVLVLCLVINYGSSRGRDVCLNRRGLQPTETRKAASGDGGCGGDGCGGGGGGCMWAWRCVVCVKET